MHIQFLNGTAQQQQWVRDAVAACEYPLDKFPASITVSFTSLTNCSLQHTYMCTSKRDVLSHFDYLIQIEPWADDPNHPENRFLPPVPNALREFFIESFVHELGHCVTFSYLLTTDDMTKASAMFTHIQDGRRGTLQDFLGTEDTIAQWADRLREGIAEWFRLAYLPAPQVYQNRTNWFLDAGGFKNLFEMLLPHGGFIYDRPVFCPVTVELIEKQTITIPQRDDPVGLDLDSLLRPLPGGGEYDNYHVEIGFPRSGFGMAVLPAPWGIPVAAPGMVVEGSAGGNFYDPGSNAVGPSVEPFDLTGFAGDVSVLRSGDQPWISGAWLSFSGGAAPHPASPHTEAGSGWWETRALRLTTQLPPGHDWGVLEYKVEGMIVNEGVGGATNIPAPPGAPWSDLRTIQGAGPSLDGPPGRFPGWIAAAAHLEGAWFTTTLNAFGFFLNWSGSAGGIVIEPGPSFVPEPNSPDFGPGPTTDILHSSGGDFWEFDWLAVPYDPLNNDLTVTVPPGFDTDISVNVFDGPTASTDHYTEVSFSVRFFPVSPIEPTTGTPPYPVAQLKPGQLGGGTLRSKEETAALARRQLQIVERLAGGSQKSR